MLTLLFWRIRGFAWKIALFYYLTIFKLYIESKLKQSAETIGNLSDNMVSIKSLDDFDHRFFQPLYRWSYASSKAYTGPLILARELNQYLAHVNQKLGQ